MQNFRIISIVAALVVAPGLVAAEPTSTASVSGTVLDPLSEGLPAAAVTLIHEGKVVGSTTTDPEGRFDFEDVATGRYQVAARAAAFLPQSSESFFVAARARVSLELPLALGIKQDVVVTASATELPASQVASPVTVIGRETLGDLVKPDLFEALRIVPGVAIVQVGGHGGPTALFVRGGQSNFNKVLVDGASANDIGGAFDFGSVATTGVERIEVLRDANSVLYGSEAMAGVVSITTRRGHSRVPELSYSVDGGNLGTHHEDLSVGGAIARFDYFADYAHLATDNDVPNSAYRNDTFASRVGWALGAATSLQATLRHIDGENGNPNATGFYGIADDSRQTSKATYVGVALHSEWSDRAQVSVRLANADLHTLFVNPSPTGEAFDPFGFGANYLGDAVTITGANGSTATGRAILDFGGAYPSRYDATTKRRAASAQATYRLQDGFDVSAGARLEHESGVGDTGSRTETKRTNAGAFAELRVARRHLYATAGLGYDHNAVFRGAVTPRLSVAYYLRDPQAAAALGGTKLVVEAGTGIKAPNLFEEQSSLFELLKSSASHATVEPIGPERSRGWEAGVEQALSGERVHVRGVYFHREFRDLIEFVSKDVLPQLGISADVAAATAFGAYVNSSSYRASGIEAQAELRTGGLRATASYTYLDAVVTKSFTGSVLAPSINPAYPDQPIGAYAPLVGASPFRRPRHSGNLMLTYAHGPAQVSVAGAFVGKADDSTFLLDGFFGNTLLLPNHELVAAYQKIDVGGSYRLLRGRVRPYVAIENLLDQRYQAAFGFPSLPRTFRIGVTGTIGGDRTSS